MSAWTKITAPSAESTSPSPRASYDPGEGPQLVLKVAIPAQAGYSTKKFELNVTVRTVINKLNESLPVHTRSDRFRLHANGLRLLDDTRTLISYGVKNMV